LRTFSHDNNVFKEVKRAFKDLDKANIFKPNNAFILKTCGDVKNMLKKLSQSLGRP
jgi:L-lysine 2,3-aminomutase